MKDTFKEIISKDLFTIKSGRIILFKKIDYTMYPSRAFALNLQKIGEDFGVNFLFNLGYQTGIIHYEELLKVLSKLNKYLPQRLNSILFIMEMTGQGKLKILKSEKDELRVTLANNPSILHSKKMYGHKSKICNFYCGLYSAILSQQMNLTKLKFKEIKCITKGDNVCEFLYQNGTRDI
ncbi:MAG: 4-vinyl reductase [Candidatus Pacearchaeota archaeon]